MTMLIALGTRASRGSSDLLPSCTKDHMSIQSTLPNGAEVEGPTAQTAIMTLFGIYGVNSELWLSTKQIIAALDPLGVSEDATRMTLARMTKKGFLTKRRLGREIQISVGASGKPILEEGHSRVLTQDVLLKDWDGRWTHVFYTLPENARTLRRHLHSALEWGGFGRLQHSVWVAPGMKNVDDLVSHIPGSDVVRSFTSVPAGSTTQEQILQGAFDLTVISRGYEAFIKRWESAELNQDASLHRRLLLHTEWLEVLRRTPVLPEALVPRDWPARRAQELFKTIDGTLAVNIESVVA